MSRGDERANGVRRLEEPPDCRRPHYGNTKKAKGATGSGPVIRAERS